MLCFLLISNVVFSITVNYLTLKPNDTNKRDANGSTFNLSCFRLKIMRSKWIGHIYVWKPPHNIGDLLTWLKRFFLPTHCVTSETMGTSPHKQTGCGWATRNLPPLPAGDSSGWVWEPLHATAGGTTQRLQTYIIKILWAMSACLFLGDV